MKWGGRNRIRPKTRFGRLKKILKLLVLGTLIATVGILAFYACNDRIVKVHEEEPYPLFESDFTEMDVKEYLTDDLRSKYDEHDQGPIHDITDYGAVEAYYGGGISKEIVANNTKAINEAINEASKERGVVLIPKGSYVSGTIHLKSHLTLRVEGNLIGSRDRADYSPNHFILGENITDVAVEGKGGRIMGEGEYFWNKPILKPLDSQPRVSDVRMRQLNHYLSKREKKDNRPSPFIFFRHCENVLIRNLLINNSPGWTLTFELSNHVHVRDTVLHNNLRGGNVDGIDIVATSNVEIERVLVSTADDGIVLKNPKTDRSVPMENITVKDARISSTTNGFKIGTETYSDIRHVQFCDSEILTTEFYPGAISGVALESVDGSEVSDILVDNITMKGVLTPLFIRVGNRNKYNDKDLMSKIDNATVKNIRSVDCQLPSIMSGVKLWNEEKWTYSVLKATRVHIKNFRATYLDNEERLLFPTIIPESPANYPEAWMFGDVPAYGIYMRHADVTLEDVHVIPRSSNTREMIVVDDHSHERHLLTIIFVLSLIFGSVAVLIGLTLLARRKQRWEASS